MDLLAATPDQMLDALCLYNAPGIPPLENPNRSNYVRGVTQARELLAAMTQPHAAPAEFEAAALPRFDSERAALLQDDPFSCAPTSLQWLLEALGAPISPGACEARMLAEGTVTREQGLMDASGAALAALARDCGVEATSLSLAGWADVQAALDGGDAILLGGRGWNHWVAVRGRWDDGSPRLMNPSPGWMGVGDTLSRADFLRLGPFALVSVDVVPGEMASPPPSGPDPRGAEISRLISLVGYLSGDVADALERARKKRRWPEVRAVEQALRAAR